MKAQLRHLHSPDARDLPTFKPDRPDWRLLIQAMVGEVDGKGAESFDFEVCSTDWLVREVESAKIVAGRHRLFMSSYDYDEILAYVLKFVALAQGQTWADVAQKLGRYGRWEFEDYTP